MTRSLNGQVLFAFALLALNTIYASQIFQMERPFASGEPGPAFLPMLLCGFVYIAMIRILLTEWRAEPAARPAVMQSDVIPKLQLVGPVGAIALIALFIIGFFYAGYVVAASLYTFTIAFFFNHEQNADWKRALVLGVVTSVVITSFGWLFFVKLFDLYLPMWEF
ncbi:MAG: tripartite tricarboxylate transporter TctB family protein [Thiothrix sp.]|nr:tripartite tricarboxylate transporter TctB family protein [Thiothrix sp.]HPE61015.1 tripartite tricarboxylate transporter TctB family protein [Thiolinea sp.]